MIVYKITNTANGKLYFGLTSGSLARRWTLHKCDAKANARGSILHKAIRKYGTEAFRVEIAYEAVDAIEARMVERGLIAQYGTITPNGYNLTTGGEASAGHRAAPEVCERLSRMRKGKGIPDALRAKANNWKGKKRSAEDVARIIERNKARKGEKKAPYNLTDEQRAKKSAAMAKLRAEGKLGTRKGCTLSAEHKAKIGKNSRARNAGKVLNEYWRQHGKLTPEEATRIRTMFFEDVPRKQIASMFNVSISMVYKIANGERFAPKEGVSHEIS